MSEISPSGLGRVKWHRQTSKTGRSPEDEFAQVKKRQTVFQEDRVWLQQHLSCLQELCQVSVIMWLVLSETGVEVDQVCIAFTHRVSMYNILFFKDCRPGDVWCGGQDLSHNSFALQTSCWPALPANTDTVSKFNRKSRLNSEPKIFKMDVKRTYLKQWKRHLAVDI